MGSAVPKINSIIQKSLMTAQIPSFLEPTGVSNDLMVSQLHLENQDVHFSRMLHVLTHLQTHMRQVTKNIIYEKVGGI